MALSISFNNVDCRTARKIKAWMFFANQFEVCFSAKNHTQNIHINFVKVERIFDWLIVNRLVKAKNNYIIVLLDQQIMKTASLALRLNVDDLFTLPLKKSHFLRSIKNICNSFNMQYNSCIFKQRKFYSNDQLGIHYLRKIILEDDFIETDLLGALTHIDKSAFPNVVCKVQGYIHQDKIKELQKNAVQLIKNNFRKAFTPHSKSVFFIPNNDYLLVLLNLPEHTCKINYWLEGRKLFQKIISKLAVNYGIQISISVGSIYNNPDQLRLSFLEAREASKFPPYKETQLYYFNDLTSNKLILKTAHFILNNLDKDLQARTISSEVNLSYTYFCRVFKREVGKGFPEYVTFARLQRALLLLRNTDYTIEEISDYVGFNTPNYFSEIFKKYLNITPSEYRQTKLIKF